MATAVELLQHTNLPISDTLPLGIGFINWGAELQTAISLIAQYRPAAVWFFAPSSISSLEEWTTLTRKASSATKVWVQVGSVKEAIDVVSAVQPDVLVVQGTDAGGHGLAQGASLITLLPEVHDALRRLCSRNTSTGSIPIPVLVGAGGIIESRTAAAALTLGASGVVLGTRILATPEAKISKGYRDEVLRAEDGGQCTVRTKVYDNCRGTTGWGETHNGRAVINKSYIDSSAGMPDDENKRLYEKEMDKGDAGWGVQARMTTYAGSGVGLVREVKPVGDVVREVREGAKTVLKELSGGGIVAKL